MNNKDYQNKELVCVTCGKEFIFTSGEQLFLNDLKENGKIDSITMPKRCQSCRQKKREERSRQETGGYPN